ncbi:aminotransferase class I/II-fold pyridoxal phosphate-dependent enzyme [Streptomyces silvisoli]|uniref:Aminotransferase class I/II-fold pyridoxal phosphate-dependent enzyme n=1 Tax=Streptomyces silvisoli TaxID=3034235 RepID=A0ABT5ZRR7_9ACTN|nr:aminotransferase class I/II-fold pyridoxal phosphate-dependent enzyme [Streptomyces silvisoli]MDF3292513.1 aminotransferase class I/II-fold pyridoxal phosphate-dependent enzyme [Streptomyces silvisoli]
MHRTAAGSPLSRPDPGLPAAPELADRFAQARDAPPQPTGGDVAVRTAACGYWERRGLATEPDRVLLAPGPAPLLLALLAAVGGDLVVPSPATAWYAAQARVLGRRVHPVATPPECGGLPDPVALLETLRRAREGGAQPRLLVVSVADDPTGTVAPPELLHEVCEAAAAASVLVACDETYRDALHDPHTVLLSPAESFPRQTVVLTDLAGALLPPSWPAAVARFPHGEPAGALLGPVRDLLDAQRAVPAAPVAQAAALALAEPAALRERTAAAVRLHAAVAAAAHRAVTRLGALCLPPQAGHQLYPDFGPLRPALAEHGVTGPDALAERLPGAVAGPWFGDDPAALRVRITTSVLYGGTPAEREAALHAAEPLRVPQVAEALAALGTAFRELTAA